MPRWLKSLLLLIILGSLFIAVAFIIENAFAGTPEPSDGLNIDKFASGLTTAVPSASSTRPLPALYPPKTPGATYPPVRLWEDVLRFTPYPWSTPLPPLQRSLIDGVYAKFDPDPPQWWRCARCPDFMPAGGAWRIWLDHGIFRMFYQVTGFATVSSFVLSGDRLFLFNDPHCLNDVGEYRWKLQNNELVLEVISDTCAINLRQANLVKQPWQSCQPPDLQAAISDHWLKPPGCR